MPTIDGGPVIPDRPTLTGILNDARDSNPLTTFSRLVTNAGIPKDAYFRNTGTSKPDFYATGVIDPRNPNSTANAAAGTWSKGLVDVLGIDAGSNMPGDYAVTGESLWTQNIPYKGMISSDSITSGWLVDPETGVVQSVESGNTRTKYGFVFHYNPNSISMGYATRTDIDPISQYVYNQEVVNSFSSMSYSTVTFSLVLNRMFDMNHIDSNSKTLKSNSAQRIYAGRPPQASEVKDIYNRGTMYDLEFLLRTIAGFSTKVRLPRNAEWDKKTADVGFITGLPVELHLGQSLRYYGRIENLNLNHRLFNERMVPILTEVQITFNRIPDNAAEIASLTPGSPASASTVETTGAVAQNQSNLLGLIRDTSGQNPGSLPFTTFNGYTSGDNPGSVPFSTSTLGG